MRKLLPSLLASLALAGCAQTYGDVMGSFGTYGIGGAYQPGGAATASIGATQGDFAYATTVLKNGTGGENPFIVDAGCGRKDIPSVTASLNDAAQATVTIGSTGGPAITNTVSRGLQMGEVARLGQVATIQAEYKQNDATHDALADYQNYSLCQNLSSVPSTVAASSVPTAPAH